MDDTGDAQPDVTALLGKTVLLVEDNIIVAMAAAESITMMGVAEVLTAASVEQAESLIAQRRPDLAILDINLGSKTSFDFARRLHTAGVPFIFASGYGDQADRPDDLGNFPIVTKPYRREQLAAAVMALIETNGPNAGEPQT